MKRVLFVDHVDRILGGAEINLIELLGEISHRKNWAVACACPSGSRLSEALRPSGVAQYAYRLPEAVNQLRIVGRRFSLANSFLGWRALAHASRALGRIRREFQADVLISCTNKDHFAAVSTAGSTPRVASAWWVNDIVSPEFFSKPARLAFRFKARKASRLIVVSDFARQALLKEGLSAEKISVIHNGIPLERYQAGKDARWRQVNRLPEDEPLMGIVGRFTPWKGQDFFLRMAAAFVEGHTRGHFVLVGQAFNEDQAYELELKRFVRERGLASRVHFVPFQENVGLVLAGLDVLIHSSTRPEPFGRVIIEAMAAGLPVIAARAGGVPEIITDGVDGLLAEPGNLENYLAQLGRLLASPELAARLAAGGRRTVGARFTIQNVREQFERVVLDAS